MRTLQEIVNDVQQLCLQLGAKQYQKTITLQNLDNQIKPLVDQLMVLEAEQKQALELDAALKLAKEEEKSVQL